ncbi:hypothetical protein T492DRAFT_941042 [Pavlovales sp. CCMP2436]|nr:hypothetical protein T492DRAFT_941042 [Pavlovales sp. CCMP2436]
MDKTKGAVNGALDSARRIDQEHHVVDKVAGGVTSGLKAFTAALTPKAGSAPPRIEVAGSSAVGPSAPPPYVTPR